MERGTSGAASFSSESSKLRGRSPNLTAPSAPPGVDRSLSDEGLGLFALAPLTFFALTFVRLAVDTASQNMVGSNTATKGETHFGDSDFSFVTVSSFPVVLRGGISTLKDFRPCFPEPLGEEEDSLLRLWPDKKIEKIISCTQIVKIRKSNKDSDRSYL